MRLSLKVKPGLPKLWSDIIILILILYYLYSAKCILNKDIVLRGYNIPAKVSLCIINILML